MCSNEVKMKFLDLFAIGLTVAVLLNRGDLVCGLSTVGRTADGLITDPEAPTETAVQEDSAKQEKPQTPVKYDGAQLWRIAYKDQLNKNAVAELQNQFGALCSHLN